MAKFQMGNFTDTFNESSRKAAEKNPFVKIPLSNIRRNENNFYSIADIDTLKHSIATTGLQSPLVVLPKNEDGNYVLLSGERRFTALSELVADGYKEFEEVYCSIIDPNDLEVNLSYDEKVKFLIVTTNSEQREMTNEDVLQQIRVLRDTYTALRNNGEDVPNTSRAFVAQALDMSETQVQRYSSIEKNLLYEFFDLFCKDVLPISVACEIAKLDTSSQMVLYSEVKNELAVTQPMVDEFIERKKKKVKKTPSDIEKAFAETKKALVNAEKYGIIKRGITEDNEEDVMQILKDIKNCAEDIVKICKKK